MEWALGEDLNAVTEVLRTGEHGLSSVVFVVGPSAEAAVAAAEAEARWYLGCDSATVYGNRHRRPYVWGRPFGTPSRTISDEVHETGW